MFKVFINFILQFLTIFLLLVSPVNAQAPTESPTSNQASSGTLMASVMEQVGYQAQNQILTGLNEQIQSVAALVYLGVLDSILITVGLLGNYRAALWILVGPPMFFYASGLDIRGQKNTVQGASVEWRFGAFRDSEVRNSQGQTLNESEIGNENTAEVSFLFHRYNELISELFQYLIGEITNNDTRAQLIFTTRTRMMEELFAQEVEVPGLVALGSYFAVNCSKEIYYASYLAQGLRNPILQEGTRWQISQDEYCRLFNEPKPLSPGPWQDYLFSLGTHEGVFISREDNEGVGRRRQAYSLTTCSELWRGLITGSRGQVLKTLEKKQKTLLATSFAIDGARTYNDVLEEIVDKITEDEGKISAEQRDQTSIDCIGESSPTSVSDGSNSSSFLANVIAPFIAKKTFTNNPYMSMLSKVENFDTHGFQSEKSIPIGMEPDQVAQSFRRQQAHQNSQNRQYEAMAMINFMPYLQGAILYACLLYTSPSPRDRG